MSIPTNTIKYVIGGTLPGNEIFQTSFWVKSSGAPALTDDQVTDFATATPATAFFNSLKALMTTGSTITAVDGYGYTGGGAASSHGHATLSIVGTSATPHPNQICLVATLRTATSGRHSRGRMYLPTNGFPMAGAGGPIVAGTQSGLIDALAAWFTQINTGATPVSVVSQTLSSTYPVTSVTADNILDTQRRRRNKMVGVQYGHSV